MNNSEKGAISAIQTFRTGEVETLSSSRQIAFTGILIELEDNGKIHLPRRHYVDAMQLMDINGYIDSNAAKKHAILKSTFKKGTGSLIWLHQTLPDIGFTISQIATQIVEACDSPPDEKLSGGLYSKIVKFVKNRPREIA